MFNIERTLGMMPTLCIVIFLTVLAILEIQELRALRSGGTSAGGFIPHGQGYEYYIDAETTVYILECGNCWKVYPVTGKKPSVPLRQDRYGSYFILNCGNAAEAETLVDRMYR